jgi:hypothetical protein
MSPFSLCPFLSLSFFLSSRKGVPAVNSDHSLESYNISFSHGHSQRAIAAALVGLFILVAMILECWPPTTVADNGVLWLVYALIHVVGGLATAAFLFWPCRAFAISNPHLKLFSDRMQWIVWSRVRWEVAFDKVGDMCLVPWPRRIRIPSFPVRFAVAIKLLETQPFDSDFPFMTRWRKWIKKSTGYDLILPPQCCEKQPNDVMEVILRHFQRNG